MIIADDEFVKIGGILLPGIFKSIEVDGSAIVEELEVEGKGKKPKQATGFEDHTVTIEIVLLDDIDGKTKEEKLDIIQNIFRKKGQKIPNIYNLVNRHTAQRGISRVIFKKLTTKESNKNNQITVSITLLEYEPVTVSVSSKKKTGSSKDSTSGNGTAASVGSEYKSYLENNRGIPPKIQDKTKGSPANELD